MSRSVTLIVVDALTFTACKITQARIFSGLTSSINPAYRRARAVDQ